MATPPVYDQRAAREAITDLYHGAVMQHWQAADYLAEALGWDLDEHLGDPPTSEWIRDRLLEVLK